MITLSKRLWPILFAQFFAITSVDAQLCSSDKGEADGAQKAPIQLMIEPQKSQAAIAEDFIGLSYETKDVSPQKNRIYYFDAKRKSLVALFKQLGVKSLRIGGNSVDAAVWPIPQEKDIDQFFDFAKAADVKVIYSLRLLNGNPQENARLAKHIYNRHRKQLAYFAIGNEPDYYKDFENQLSPQWNAIYQKMKEVAPEVPFCGPDANPKKALYEKFQQEFILKNPAVELLTFHNYTGGCAYENPSAKTVQELRYKDGKKGRELLLAEEMHETDAENYAIMKDILKKQPYRLAETNNIWFGGLLDASDTYAAALWALKYMYWWAEKGAQGVNFHTGDFVGGEKVIPSRYAAFVTEGTGYNVRPLSYAMKMFSLGAKGNVVPLVQPKDKALYCIATKNGNEIAVTIINKTYDETAETKGFLLTLPEGYTISGKANVISLEAPNGDVAAKKALTIGGASIESDGKWNGKWTSLDTNKHSLEIFVSPASATIVKFNYKPNTSFSPKQAK